MPSARYSGILPGYGSSICCRSDDAGGPAAGIPAGGLVHLVVGDGRHAGLCHRRAILGYCRAMAHPSAADLMMLADRRRAFLLAGWCTLWSVMGGMLGYAIGALFWDTAGLWLIHLLPI